MNRNRPDTLHYNVPTILTVITTIPTITITIKEEQEKEQ